jgi:hypothetical protein
MNLTVSPLVHDRADQGAETLYSAAELLAAAREVIAASDRLDGQLAARLAAHAEGYRLGAGQAAGQWQAGYAAAIAAEKAVQHELVDALGELAEIRRRRWHLCCLPCRRAGHRPGCRDCQDRTRETFADPLEGEYFGGPVAWLPGWVPGSGEAPALEAAA